MFKSLVARARALGNIPFVRDVLAMQMGSILLMGAGLLYSIASARLLGKQAFGMYAVIVTFAGTFGMFFNIGQGQSLYVFFSEALGKKSREEMAAVLANFIAVAGINILLLGALWFLMPWLSLRFYGSTEIGMYARILCIFQMSEIGNSMTLILLQSVREIRVKICLEQLGNLSYMGLAALVLFLGGGIRGMLVTQLCVSLCMLPLSVIALQWLAKRYRLPGVREVLRVPWRRSSQYLTQGLLITADKTIGNFFPQGIFFFFSLFVPASFIGVARIAVQLANMPRSILLPQVGDLSTAAFGKMKAQGEAVIRKNAVRLMKHAFVLHGALTLGAALTLPIFITLFYGQEYRDAIPLTLGLLAILLFNSFSIINGPLLRLYRKMHFSIATGALNWTLMIGTIYTLARVLPPTAAFLLVYGIGITTPLLLTLYVFCHLLHKQMPAAA